MSGRTPKLDLTIPDINDYIAAWPGIAEQGFLDLENSLIIDLHHADDLWDTYPIGPSMFGVTTSGAADNGWPEGSGMVLSWRRPAGGGDLTFQYKISQGIERAPIVYARTGSSATAPGWSPWGIAASRVPTVAAASGTVRVQDLAVNTSKETTVALPSSFSAAPTIGLTVKSYYPAGYMVCVSEVSAASFSFRVNRVLDSATNAVDIMWTATQSGA